MELEAVREEGVGGESRCVDAIITTRRLLLEKRKEEKRSKIQRNTGDEKQTYEETAIVMCTY